MEKTAIDDPRMLFRFRPWVRRAGFSIVVVASGVTLLIAVSLGVSPSLRYGWFGEPFVWIYIGTLWLGGLKVWLGTRRPVAEIDDETLTLRPLHQFRTRSIPWPALVGTEQMTGGDRMIVYFDTASGMRFVALNLNLVKGRREFVREVDARLEALGLRERIVERSRYMSKPVESKPAESKPVESKPVESKPVVPAVGESSEG